MELGILINRFSRLFVVCLFVVCLLFVLFVDHLTELVCTFSLLISAISFYDLFI